MWLKSETFVRLCVCVYVGEISFFMSVWILHRGQKESNSINAVNYVLFGLDIEHTHTQTKKWESDCESHPRITSMDTVPVFVRNYNKATTTVLLQIDKQSPQPIKGNCVSVTDQLPGGETPS